MNAASGTFRDCSRLSQLRPQRLDHLPRRANTDNQQALRDEPGHPRRVQRQPAFRADAAQQLTTHSVEAKWRTMSEHSDGEARRHLDHDNQSDHPSDDQARPTTLRRRKPARSGRIAVERVETVPVTEEQYRRAVQALATLISEWRDRTNDDKNSPKPE